VEVHFSKGRIHRLKTCARPQEGTGREGEVQRRELEESVGGSGHRATRSEGAGSGEPLRGRGEREARWTDIGMQLKIHPGCQGPLSDRRWV